MSRARRRAREPLPLLLHDRHAAADGERVAADPLAMVIAEAAPHLQPHEHADLCERLNANGAGVGHALTGILAEKLRSGLRGGVGHGSAWDEAVFDHMRKAKTG